MEKKNLGKLSIDQLEELLNKDEETEISILPNGEITATINGVNTDPKVLTFRENLGGEYTI